jgi:serine/threonine-protein kinase HipA
LWIGRLPNGSDLSHSVENEHLRLALAAALGLPTANVEMATFDGQRVRIFERFDRLITPNHRLIRVRQEDCRQALSVPWTRKYESDGGPGAPAILRLLAGSVRAVADQRLFLKANLAFWLLGAPDVHAKKPAYQTVAERARGFGVILCFMTAAFGTGPYPIHPPPRPRSPTRALRPTSGSS